jgi:hypothetical protein
MVLKPVITTTNRIYETAPAQSESMKRPLLAAAVQTPIGALSGPFAPPKQTPAQARQTGEQQLIHLAWGHIQRQRRVRELTTSAATVLVHLAEFFLLRLPRRPSLFTLKSFFFSP